jgi:hypothetical protein
LYISLSHYNKITSCLYTEFSISAGINVLKYNLKLQSVYDVYGIDELKYPYNAILIEDRYGLQNDKINIISGRNLFIPNENGKKPMQIGPYLMLDFRFGFNL